MLSLPGRGIGAQTPPSASDTASPIQATDLARHIAALRGDSLRERATPSRGLERAAGYVAEQFAKLGLSPVRIPHPVDWGARWGTPPGDDTTFSQRYPVAGQLRPNYESSPPRLFLEFFVSKNGQPTIDTEGLPIGRSFEAEASFAIDTVARALGTDFGGEPGRMRNLLVVTGPHTLSSVQQVRATDRTVLYVPPAGGDTVLDRQIINYLSRGSVGVVIPVPEDSAAFARRRLRSQATVILDDYLAPAKGARWATYVRSERLQAFLAAMGIDIAQARTAATPLIRELPLLGVRLAVETKTDTVTSPNVLGAIAGTQYQYGGILIMARLDHTSAADDNTAGVAGLLALAHAFSQPGTRPRRPIIFAAMSGGRNGFWGSKYYALAALQVHTYLATVNLDRIGSDPGDSVFVDGLSEVKLAKSLQWMTSEHPELRLTVVDGGSIFEPTSDHSVFARRAIPGLSFRGRSDRLPEIAADQDAERLARFVRLAFYTGQELTNGVIPKWSDVGRRRLVELLGENP